MIASGRGHLGRRRLLQLVTRRGRGRLRGARPGGRRVPRVAQRAGVDDDEPGRVQGVAHRPGEAGAGRREDLVGADGDAGGVRQRDRGTRADARRRRCRPRRACPRGTRAARRTTRRRPRPRSRPSRAPRRSRPGRAGCGTCRRRPARPPRGCRWRPPATRPRGRTGTRRSGRRPGRSEPSRDRLHSAGVVRVVTSSQRTPGHADEEDRGLVRRLRGGRQEDARQAQHQGEHRAAEHGRARAGRGQHRSSLRAHYPRPRRRCGVSVQRAHHLHGRDAMSEGLPRYAYLGPAGTFTEAALRQVAAVGDCVDLPVSDVSSAIEAVRTGDADFAVVAIESTVEGGVTATLDSLAGGDPLVIVREMLVPVQFTLAAAPGVRLAGRPAHLRPPARVGAVPALAGAPPAVRRARARDVEHRSRGAHRGGRGRARASTPRWCRRPPSTPTAWSRSPRTSRTTSRRRPGSSSSATPAPCRRPPARTRRPSSSTCPTTRPVRCSRCWSSSRCAA